MLRVEDTMAAHDSAGRNPKSSEGDGFMWK